MRNYGILQAYLDDFQLIKFYFNKMSYGGVSKKFYLKDNSKNVQELKIIKTEETQNYFIYHLHVENIEIGKAYVVEHEFARTTPLQYGLIVKTKRFDEMFRYTKNDLGATFTNNTTIFKVFAPTASRMQLILPSKEVEMKKEGSIYTIELPQYLHGVAYRYRVFCNGTIKETIDPYCIQVTNNNEYSIAFDKKTLNPSKFVDLKRYTDAIIYEASVADFTMQYAENSSTYTAMTSEKSVEYLKNLGFTHLQLLPVTTCGSTDDYLPKLHYNWGYDITHFQALTNRYALENAVHEFAHLVDTYHKNQIGIVLDMVFNHVHDFETSPLQILVPNYYFQMNQNAELSNGTYCGNDFDSLGYMARKLVVDSCVSWVKNFGVDGFRFDLMGILDTVTLNEIYDVCSKINPSFILYGEGWNMPSILDESKRASIQNQSKMPNVAHFNDFFRDILKGKNNEKGFLTTTPFSGDSAMIAFLCSNYDHPSKSISYFECHDNHTLWDYLTIIEKDEEIRLKKFKMLMMAIFTSFGIPFIHSGQEFARTKNMLDNTYRDNSGINAFDWKKTTSPLVTFTKKLIEIRKKYPELRMDNHEAVQKVQIDYIGEDVIAYEVERLLIVFNPTSQKHVFDVVGTNLLSNEKIHSLKIEPYQAYIVEKQ